MSFRENSSPPTPGDVALGAALTAVVILGTSNIEPNAGDRAVDALAFTCAVGAAASLVLRRWWPELMASIVTVGVLTYAARGYPGGPVFLVLPVGMYSLAWFGPRRTAYVWAGGVIAAIAASALVWGDGIGTHQLILSGWAAAAVFAADAVRGRADRAAAAHAREEEEARRSLTEERLRIAQDLHDSVAHSMATITVQSGVAAHLLDRRPEQASVALEAIRAASSDVLDELGAILGVLRRDDGGIPRLPTAGLTAVSDLVERARANGLAVELVTTGDASADPSPPVSAAAYRVVQEALTNVMRHATGAAAQVKVTHRDHGLEVTVTDDGPGARGRSVGSGIGLVGMRERVEASGGTLKTGPAPDGGFRVAASWTFA